MALCKTELAEEYVIHVVESTNSYTHLRFSLLASPWLLRPLGVALWSVFHMLLVGTLGCMSLMLLAFFSVVFVIAFFYDALTLCVFIIMLLVFYFLAFLPKCMVSALVWMFLVFSCTIPGRSPDQGLGYYILSAGGLLTPALRNPQLLGSARGINLRAALEEFGRKAQTVRLVKYLMPESVLFWRLVSNLSREIVPLYDTVVIR